MPKCYTHEQTALNQVAETPEIKTEFVSHRNTDEMEQKAQEKKPESNHSGTLEIQTTSSTRSIVLLFSFPKKKKIKVHIIFFFSIFYSNSQPSGLNIFHFCIPSTRLGVGTVGIRS